MNLAAQLRSLPAALRMHKIYAAQERAAREEYTAQQTARKRKNAANYYGKQSNAQRSAEFAAERAKWREVALAQLEQHEPMTSAALGEVMGISRQAAYRRLENMEAEGHVIRTGAGIRTRWEILRRN